MRSLSAYQEASSPKEEKKEEGKGGGARRRGRGGTGEGGEMGRKEHKDHAKHETDFAVAFDTRKRRKVKETCQRKNTLNCSLGTRYGDPGRKEGKCNKVKGAQCGSMEIQGVTRRYDTPQKEGDTESRQSLMQEKSKKRRMQE